MTLPDGVSCSFYLGALDVALLQITVGTNTLQVSNSAVELVANWINTPGINRPWYDGNTKQYGVTIATQDFALPGWYLLRCLFGDIIVDQLWADSQQSRQSCI